MVPNSINFKGAVSRLTQPYEAQFEKKFNWNMLTAELQISLLIYEVCLGAAKHHADNVANIFPVW